MNLKVKVNDQLFDVKIDNLRDRPIRVDVDGEIFEVWPETSFSNPMTQDQLSHVAQPKNIGTNSPDILNTKNEQHSTDTTPTQTQNTPPGTSLLYIRAPIPGVITAITTEVGSEVTLGQELCKLEAMKMNNSIRSNRNGIISTIHVSIGQHVRHNDVLIEFSD